MLSRSGADEQRGLVKGPEEDEQERVSLSRRAVPEVISSSSSLLSSSLTPAIPYTFTFYVDLFFIFRASAFIHYTTLLNYFYSKSICTRKRIQLG